MRKKKITLAFMVIIVLTSSNYFWYYLNNKRWLSVKQLSDQYDTDSINISAFFLMLVVIGFYTG